MTHEEFANKVTQLADNLILEMEFEEPAISICACIEAACNLANKYNKINMVAEKFKSVARLLEAIQ